MASDSVDLDNDIVKHIVDVVALVGIHEDLETEVQLLSSIKHTIFRKHRTCVYADKVSSGVEQAAVVAGSFTYRIFINCIFTVRQGWK